jgi:hypothetical protein
MSRRIVTEAYHRTGGESVDTYFDKVIKYIPSDIVGAWIFVTGLISAATNVPTNAILWTTFIIGVIITFFWTRRWTLEPGKPPAMTQSIISTGAFIVWVFALGGPFATLAFYRPLYGALLLVFYTLVVALINPPEK